MAPVDARSIGPVAWYYLATPVFLVLDLLGGVSLRVVALDDVPGLKFLYYLGCLGCGVVAAAWPRLTAALGVAESLLNIGLAIITLALGYIRLVHAALSGKVMANPFTSRSFVNVGLCAVVAYIAYRSDERAVSRAFRRVRFRLARLGGGARDALGWYYLATPIFLVTDAPGASTSASWRWTTCPS